jgi:formamidopyrimidine-DNA glycosylase
MPELPEVEVICRGLRPHLIGRTITRIRHSGFNLRVPVPVDELSRHIANRVVIDVDRRAKYLIITVEGGTKMLIHLGMSGRLGFFPQQSPVARHDHLRLLLDNDIELRFNDARRFGAVHVFSGADAANLERSFFARSGPEPFSREYSAQYLLEKAKGRQSPVKVFLMTNEIVVGIGNIYANEILFAARIAPTRRAATLSLAEWRRIVAKTRLILKQAIDCGGSTISDFANANHESGYFQVNFRVYDCKGQPCQTCSRAIEKIQLGGRACYYCPKCQK